MTADLDDFAIVSDSEELKIENDSNGVLFMIATPKKLNYQTYSEIMKARMSA
jgi:hypothetical protein